MIWELSGTGEDRQRQGLRLIGYAFAALALYLLVQSTLVLAAGFRPRHSPAGIIWTAVTAVAMFALAVGKARTGRALGNPVLRTEGRVTAIDGILAVAVLAGLVLNAAAGAADLPRVFERVWHGSSANGRYGTGTGLAVVAGLAVAHGRIVTAASPPGGGAVFTLALPAA